MARFAAMVGGVAKVTIASGLKVATSAAASSSNVSGSPFREAVFDLEGPRPLDVAELAESGPWRAVQQMRKSWLGADVAEARHLRRLLRVGCARHRRVRGRAPRR